MEKIDFSSTFYILSYNISGNTRTLQLIHDLHENYFKSQLIILKLD